jgi:hypothetical protein
VSEVLLAMAVSSLQSPNMEALRSASPAEPLADLEDGDPQKAIRMGCSVERRREDAVNWSKSPDQILSSQ